MGKFDEVHFEHRMPDDVEARTYYQTKDLDREGDLFEISAKGRLVLIWNAARRGKRAGTEYGDMNFTGVLNLYCREFFGQPHSYELTFVAGTLSVIECKRSGVKATFGPVGTDTPRERFDAAPVVEAATRCVRRSNQARVTRRLSSLVVAVTGRSSKQRVAFTTACVGDIMLLTMLAFSLLTGFVPPLWLELLGLGCCLKGAIEMVRYPCP